MKRHPDRSYFGAIRDVIFHSHDVVRNSTRHLSNKKRDPTRALCLTREVTIDANPVWYLFQYSDITCYC